MQSCAAVLSRLPCRLPASLCPMLGCTALRKPARPSRLRDRQPLPPCLPCLLCSAPAPKPMGAAGADGNLAAGAAGQQLSGDAWLAMALASGWRQDMPKRKALEQAFGSVLVF